MQQLFKITKGMNQDVDILSATPDSAYRLFNIKTLTLDDSTSNALTNEKGNSIIKVIDENTNDETFIGGIILGVIQCTIDTVVLFTYIDGVTNAIYRVTYKNDNLYCKLLAKGKFNIPKTSTVSGIFVYEHSELLKVYWVDGVNQLRYINIADSNVDLLGTSYITSVEKLNSNPTFKLDHHITVERIKGGGGIFTAGIILYAFTYFNKYGAETNIVDITPMYYISEDNRGLESDETTGCSFKVTIENPDTSFDFIRLYSILRQSLNGPALVKIVGNIQLNKKSL